MARTHIINPKGDAMHGFQRTYCGLEGQQSRALGASHFDTPTSDAFEVAIRGEKATCKRCLKGAIKAESMP